MDYVRLHDDAAESRLVRNRLLFAAVLAAVLAALLVARVVYLQVSQHESYMAQSRENRIRLIPVAPPRGLIYDRNGVLLARNVSVFNLEVDPEQVQDMDGLLHRLSQLVEIGDAEVNNFTRTLGRARTSSLLLRTRLSQEELARFSVNRHRFPGVEIRTRLQRLYPLGDLTAHVLGYVGRISADDLEQIDAAAYRGVDHIGKLGLESWYERDLLGRPGFEQVETNAHGRIIRLLSRTPPAPGRNLRLGLDIELQRVALDALGAERGAVVAIEPASGDVLAMASSPAYNANRFVRGIDSASYQVLSESPDKPLLNRALRGRYSPGSTIKSVVGLALLEADAAQKTHCPGWFSLPGSSRRYRCWKREGHGNVDLHAAIVQSCDVYFYRAANALGIEPIARALRSFGLGRATGIDTDGELSGLVPDPQWKRAAVNESWFPGETLITAIGQGATLVTPLQLAMLTATLANRGAAIRPRLVTALDVNADGEFTAEEERKPLRLGEGGAGAGDEGGPIGGADDLRAVISAMVDVVHGERGTARHIKTERYTIAGKTGTAQVISIAQDEEYDAEKLDKKFHDHALFIAFAPAEAPAIAVAVIVENGGSGSTTAAPIARRVMDHHLRGLTVADAGAAAGNGDSAVTAVQ